MPLAAAGSETHRPPFSTRDSLGRLVRLVRKELSEIVRDRRTIVTLVLMPLLLYPLLAIAFQQVAAANLLHPERIKEKRPGLGAPAKGALPDFQIAVEDEEQKEIVHRILKIGEKYYGPRHLGFMEVWRLEVALDLESEVQIGKYDVGVRVLNGKLFRELPKESPIPKDDSAFQNQELILEIVSLAGSPHSRDAADMVQRRLLWFHQRMVGHRLLDHDPYRPIALAHLEQKVLKAARDDTLISLPALVPLILILMTITGAVYPAIDTTAGERERGTLEMLVAAPVPRIGLLFAKYVTVVAVAVLTGLVNLAGMAVTLRFSGLEAEVIQGGLSFGVLLQVVALLLLFALFFSAVLLSLTSFARSFKEAQAYLIPLMLVSLGPGIFGILPGIKLDGVMVVVPLVNIVLLGRDLFEGRADPATALLVVLVTLVYAGAAIALAARVFGAESVLYSEQSGWSDLFRRPEQPQEAASVGAALWCLALMIPVHYVAQGTMVLIGVHEAAWRMGLAVALSVLLFLGFPLLAAWLGRVRAASGFALSWPGFVPLAAALLMGLFLWPGVLWALSFLVEFMGLPTALREQVAEEMRFFHHMLPLGVLMTAVSAAIVEEIFFRGFLFSALERICPPWTTVLATAFLFGLMHLVMGGPLGPQRFLPSAAMGVLLGWTRLAGGSLWPGLMLHALYNGSMVLAVQRGADQWEVIPTVWVLAAAASLIVGNALLAWAYRRKSFEPASIAGL